MNPTTDTSLGSALWHDLNNILSDDQLTQDDSLPDLLNLSSDMESFMALDSIQEVKEEETTSTLAADLLAEIGIDHEEEQSGSNQSLIDEVENYLQSVSDSPSAPGVADVWMEDAWDNKDVLQKGEEELLVPADADKIFAALTSGNIVQESDGRIKLSEAELKNAFTTSVVDKNGGDVIIIIAPAEAEDSSAVSPSQQRFTASPVPSVKSPASWCSSGSDYEWTPSPASVSATDVSSPTSLTDDKNKPRKKYQRRVRPTAPVGPYPKEKTERKKAQNRTAAFKYREKKRLEQEAVDEELAYLCDRNAVLKKKMADMEIELKCLKNLMIQTGLDVYMK